MGLRLEVLVQRVALLSSAVERVAGASCSSNLPSILGLHHELLVVSK